MGGRVKKPSLRVGYAGYRGWAFGLLDQVLAGMAGMGVIFPLIVTGPYDKEKIDYAKYDNLHVLDPSAHAALISLVGAAKLDVMLFYGWSWIVPAELTASLDCLCLHPSLLPKYRGGTPLQHQILSDEQETGLTIFRMNDILDGGDILAQRRFPLTGTISDIYGQMRDYGAQATITILRDYQAGRPVYTPQQNLNQHPSYRRRTPAQSEIAIEQLAAMPTRYFYNFVRALGDPYPNCFIRLTDGGELQVQEAAVVRERPPGSVVFNGTSASVTPRTVIALQDGYVWLVRYRVQSQVH